jgi:hypothetical protein
MFLWMCVSVGILVFWVSVSVCVTKYGARYIWKQLNVFSAASCSYLCVSLGYDK